jgi:hypothetical protein
MIWMISHFGFLFFFFLFLFFTLFSVLYFAGLCTPQQDRLSLLLVLLEVLWFDLADSGQSSESKNR